jgi:hypothetical protein
MKHAARPLAFSYVGRQDPRTRQEGEPGMSQYGPSDPATSPRETKQHQWVHLLWTIPLALPFAAVAVFLGAVTRCGLGQCTGGGFGHAPSDPALTALFFVGSSLILALPLFMVPWARPSIRLPVAAVVATLWFAYWWMGMR